MLLRLFYSYKYLGAAERKAEHRLADHEVRPSYQDVRSTSARVSPGTAYETPVNSGTGCVMKCVFSVPHYTMRNFVKASARSCDAGIWLDEFGLIVTRFWGSVCSYNWQFLDPPAWGPTRTWAMFGRGHTSCVPGRKTWQESTALWLLNLTWRKRKILCGQIPALHNQRTLSWQRSRF